MSVKQEFLYHTSDGSPAVPLHVWVSALPPDQKQEFIAARQRQLAIRQQYIESGDLVVYSDILSREVQYVWKDDVTAQRGKPFDLVWQNYFNRYLEENNIKFENLMTQLQEEKK
jgi:hypothetical protein